MLSEAYQEIKSLRSTGQVAMAYSRLRSAPPVSDEDAFEAVVCLFIYGDTQSARNVCQTFSWREAWARGMAQAVAVMVTNGDPAEALAAARPAIQDVRAGYDGAAMFLLMLLADGRVSDAQSFIQDRLTEAPLQETFLLTVMAEVAVAAKDWRQAYKWGSAVMAADPDDYRALLTLSRANQATGNVHGALGDALRANQANPGSPPAIYELMRCHNRLGDYHAAIGAFTVISDQASLSPELHVELATAYAGVENTERAEAAYRKALASDQRPIAAIRGLLRIFSTRGDAAALSAAELEYRAEIHGDIECLAYLGKAALAEHDLARAQAWFDESFQLAVSQRAADGQLPWPVPEPRIRHDYEQLALLDQRGLLDAVGRDALRVLKRYHDQSGDPQKRFAPEGLESVELKAALTRVHHRATPAFTGRALGDNDYAAIEDRYFSSSPPVVVIDNFLSPEGLAALRRHCEEANVWKMSNDRGYVGALLAQGFSSPVLLKVIDELRRSMPRVIGDHALTQAWGFKYDQRMWGIDMHADFAAVNVNFWVTPEAGCEDKTTGGMVVYDLPAPTSWTFADYNTNQPKMKAFLEVHDAKSMRVPFRENRCVLFDSSLIHVTDELHFRPGYENRRVNVTLLYGRARSLQ